MLVPCLAYPSTLTMEKICSSKTLVNIQLTARLYTPRDRIYHNHCIENLKSYKYCLFTVHCHDLGDAICFSGWLLGWSSPYSMKAEIFIFNLCLTVVVYVLMCTLVQNILWSEEAYNSKACHLHRTVSFIVDVFLLDMNLKINELRGNCRVHICQYVYSVEYTFSLSHCSSKWTWGWR
jgi:hypothetical protein